MTFSASNSQSLSDDTLAKVDYIAVSCHDPPVQVYNFVVKDFHTYYVSEDCVPVHNDKNICGGGNGNQGGKRVFTSKDPFVGETANAIENRFPGKVVDVNKTVYKADGNPLTDYDIELDNTVIQVKSGGGKGATNQVTGVSGKMILI